MTDQFPRETTSDLMTAFTSQSADVVVLIGNRNVAFDDIAHTSIFVDVRNAKVVDLVNPSEAMYQ